ncbi:hypothetical protein, partial [Isoptericola sp. NPDC057191]|uniref:hypothetical protein n=1 Tax=Isoptericola sp. NPDC057191 TaxID=3346041 RepID=UPI00363E3CD8
MRTALALTVLAALGTALTAGTDVDGIGELVRFPLPVPVPQFVALLAGIAIGAAATYRVDPRFPVGPPGTRRLRAARLGWVTAVTVVVGTLTTIGFAGAPFAAYSSVAANVVLFGGLALLAVAAGQADLLWLPPAALLLVAMLYGSGDLAEDFFWWASCLQDTAGPARWGASLAVFLVALAAYARATPRLAARGRHG